MDKNAEKQIKADPDGLITYEYIANNMGRCDEDMPMLVDNMIRVDHNGQFTVSAARYLAAIDRQGFRNEINRLIAASIEKDREHIYIGQLLTDIWGADYQQHADELSSSDDNFRRIYKRLFPTGI